MIAGRCNKRRRLSQKLASSAVGMMAVSPAMPQEELLAFPRSAIENASSRVYTIKTNESSVKTDRGLRPRHDNESKQVSRSNAGQS
jgi:hypothetical protein